MTIGSGGSFGGGDGGSYSSSFEHGRTSGGIYTGSSHDRDRDTGGYHPSYRDDSSYYGPGRYSHSGYDSYSDYMQSALPRDEKTELLKQNQACCTFGTMSMLIGTFWLLVGPYGANVIGLDVNASRLVTANSFWAKSIHFENVGQMKGPVVYGFHYRPELDSVIRWSDYQNFTLNHWHQEFYYYLNGGSSVKIRIGLRIPDNLVVYFKIVRGTKDLEEFLERPDQASYRVRDYLEISFDASADDDYILAFVNIHPVFAEMAVELDFNNRKYNLDHARERCDLKSSCEMKLSIFGTRYAVLETPGMGEVEADNWGIRVSYGHRWLSILSIFAFFIALFLVRRRSILKKFPATGSADTEQAPLVVSSAENNSISPLEPTIPSTIPEGEEEYHYSKDKEVSEDHLCTVCFDAPKDCFFVPCGHRATCFSCGLRIKRTEPAVCPICRVPITEVKKIYDA